MSADTSSPPSSRTAALACAADCISTNTHALAIRADDAMAADDEEAEEADEEDEAEDTALSSVSERRRGT